MHLEAISLKQKKIFDRLKEFSGYYLVGGTALALQIGHRVSVDFDFFSEKNITSQLLAKIKRIFRDFKIEIIVNHSGQLIVHLDKIGLTFVKYPFPLIFKLIEHQKVKMLSISEIAVSKAYTLGRRATFKDYVDLYFVIKEKYLDLQEIIKLSQKKYKEFNTRLFLEQLIYLEDVEEMEIQFLKKKVTKDQIQNFLKNEVKKLGLAF